jgi:uncharacterized protein
MIIKIMIVLMALVTSVFAEKNTKFFKPSFSCEKVKQGSIEYKICTDEVLAKLDKKVSNIYKSFPFISKEIIIDQRAWIKQRNKCKDNRCIQEAYQGRLQELNYSLKNAKTFPKHILDAMKEAEATLQIQWDPIVFSKQELIDAGMQFKDDLFRFKNVTFKVPLIAGVQYDDSKLKEILGACYYYRFDLEVKEYPAKYIEDGRKYWVEDERKPFRDLNVSVWKTTAKGKEWLFIKPTDKGRSFLIDMAICEQKRLKNNIVDALNYNRKQIKMSQSGLYDAAIVNYKNKEYVFDLFLIHDHAIEFIIYDVLGTTSSEDPTIQFTGTWPAAVTFKKTNMKQGEK